MIDLKIIVRFQVHPKPLHVSARVERKLVQGSPQLRHSDGEQHHDDDLVMRCGGGLTFSQECRLWAFQRQVARRSIKQVYLSYQRQREDK